MKKAMAGLFILMVAGMGFGFVSAAHAAEGDQEALLAASERFYAALNSMFTGEIEPMKAVWSHADDVAYMGPGGGLITGWEKVSAIWDEQAALKLGGKVTPVDMAMTLGEDMAVTYGTEIGENYDQEGNLQKVSIRATNVYRKENGEWKMIGHHTDLLPYLEESLRSKGA
ncbi:MAG: nuclear transport factor 2 family protein [Candidatus Omnitrophica bacterium]|nr:nuclear transport factor 2 family protein [Candidatus Omnitrophota bacterium]